MTTKSWDYVSFENAPIEIIDGDRGFNYPKQNDFYDKGYCLFLNANNVTNQGFNFDNKKFVSKGIDTSLRKGKLVRRDIVLTTRGTVGNVAYFDQKVAFENIRINSGMVIFRVIKHDVLMPEFLYQLLRSPIFQNQVIRFTTGSAQPQLPIRDIKQIHIPIPPITEQRAITEALSALDDKIELNRRMNQTLEKIARSLYKYWFIDFKPVKEEYLGIRSTITNFENSYASPETFENELVSGWKRSTIGEEVIVKGGSTPSTSRPEYWGGDINWATPKDLALLTSPALLGTAHTISVQGLNQISSGLLPAGTALLSSRAPIGYFAISDIPVAINQGFIAMQCNKDLSVYYVWLWTLANMDTIKNRANGTTFMEISKSNFRPIPILVPPKPVMDAFNSIIEPIYKKIILNEKENKKLTEIRDLLLPKLMSGKVKIK